MSDLHVQKRKLRELMATDIIRGISLKPSDDEGDEDLTEIINIRNLIEGRVLTTSLEKRDVSGIKDISRILTIEGDVIIAVKGSTFKAATIDSSSRNRIISSNLVALRLNNMIKPEILVAYLNSQEGQHQLNLRSKGATIPAINPNDLLEIEIPIPSDKTQYLLKEYLISTDRYLGYLKKEEDLVKQMKNYMISSFLEVPT